MLHSIVDHSIPEPNSGCWLWLGTLCNGYGVIQEYYGWELAHRRSYRLFKGPITAPVIRHLCNNRGCVNPDHLEQGTKKDNAADYQRSRRKP